MTTRPALVATDLDGTLLGSDGLPSPRTVEAVRRVETAGIEFVVVTARPPRWMHELIDVIGAHGVAICTNGAFVYDVAERVILAERTIPWAIVAELAGDLRAAIPGVGFAVETIDGYGQEEHYVNLHDLPGGSPIGPVEGLFTAAPGKLLARAPGLPDEVFLAEVARVVGARAIVSVSGFGGLAEINASGVTKAAVLAEWCAERGIGAKSVWAFGDMPNDLPMLKWAGTSFAMANAHPDVIAVATHHAASNDDDGVAQVLEAMLAHR